jgi:hypothetical protein
VSRVSCLCQITARADIYDGAGLGVIGGLLSERVELFCELRLGAFEEARLRGHEPRPGRETGSFVGRRQNASRHHVGRLEGKPAVYLDSAF